MAQACASSEKLTVAREASHAALILPSVHAQPPISSWQQQAFHARAAADRRCREHNAREKPVISPITQTARERIAVGGESGFQFGPFGLGKQRFGCRQQLGLFGAHVVQVNADILLRPLLEGRAARLAHQFPRQQQVLQFTYPSFARHVVGFETADHRHERGPQRPLPAAGEKDLLLGVLACGVCRTDLHIIDAELPPRRPNVVPGHEVVGEVVALGSGVTGFKLGQPVGIPWLAGTCGGCGFCVAGRENLCDQPVFTGYDRDGGFAEYIAADAGFCFPLPERYDNAHAAPLLCAGLIGFRAWKLGGGEVPRRLGLWGFGAAADIICQITAARGQEVFAFTRPGDPTSQKFARSLGAARAGGSDEAPPAALDTSLIFAPAGERVPLALGVACKGGSVVCAGIHMSRIPAFDYGLLWGERVLRSVANLTRADGEAFARLLGELAVQTHVQTFPLRGANAAVHALRSAEVNGAAVLVP